MNGRRHGHWVMSALATVILVATLAAEATAAVTSNSAAAILAYPYLELDSSRGLDTFVQLTNTATSPVNVSCFYENTTAHCTDTAQACRSAADCAPGIACNPGWVPSQFQIQLVRRQPIGWRVSQGLSPPSAPISGSIPPVSEDPFVGALRCVVVDQTGAAVAANVLIGHATLVQNRTDAQANFDVAKYNAVGLQAVTGDANADGQLVLGGDASEYQGCAGTLVLNHFFDQATEPVLHTGSVQTTLALLPCSVDYANGIPAQSSVSFLVTNEFGTTVAGDQSFAVSGQLVATLDSPLLQVGTQGTLTGTTVLRATGTGVIAVAFETHRNLENTADQKSSARTIPGRGERSAADVIVVGSSGSMPTLTPTPAPSATPTATACVGDCDGQGSVTVDEILTMVNIALGNADVSACQAGDANQDGQMTVDEILTAVNNALNGCGSLALSTVAATDDSRLRSGGGRYRLPPPNYQPHFRT